MQSLGRGTSSKDDGVGGDGLSVLVPLSPELEGSLGQIDLGDGLCDDLGAKLDGLRSHVVHETGARDSLGETGEVLNVGGGGKLATGSNAVSKHTLVKSGLDLGTGEVDSSGWAAGPEPMITIL